MIPALFLIPLVALFRIFMAWQPTGRSGLLASSWLPGFTPVAAVALCAGMFLPRRLALVVPLGILLLSDAIIDAHYGAHSFRPQRWSTTHCWPWSASSGWDCAAPLFHVEQRLASRRTRRDAGRIRVFLRCQQRPGLARFARLSADRCGLVARAHPGPARLSAVLRFFPKRTCQRRPLFYGVRRLCPPFAATRGTPPFLCAGRARTGHIFRRRGAARGLIRPHGSVPGTAPAGEGSHTARATPHAAPLTGFPSARP